MHQPAAAQHSLDTAIKQEQQGKGKTLAFFITFTQKRVYATMNASCAGNLWRTD